MGVKTWLPIMQSLRLLVVFLAIFSLVAVTVGKGKGKGKGKGQGSGNPTQPSDEDWPCFFCLYTHSAQECIPLCEEGPPHSWQCRECVVRLAPMCLRVCGFPWLQEKLLEQAQVDQQTPDPCVLQKQGLPLQVGGNNAVSSSTPKVLEADACGLQCVSDPNSIGWTWANDDDTTIFKHTCWCLSLLGVPMGDVTRDSSTISNCPP